MTEVVSFIDYRPPSRYDAVPWTEALIEEATAQDGTYAQIDTVALSPLDSDPSSPMLRSFTTSLGTAPSLWYRVRFEDGSAGLSLYTAPVQNIPGAVYATVSELMRILKIRTPSTDQQAAAERVLATAAGEINAEIDLAATDTLEGWELDLCASVNLDRAADLWRHTESIPGLAGVLEDAPMAPAGYTRYSWERYAQRLAPVKRQFGFA